MGKYFGFMAFLLMIVSSCQKVVDADGLLEADAEVFIQSYLSPQDTVIRVQVSRALPVVGTTLNGEGNEANETKFLIRDAVVTISDEEENSIDLTFSENNKAYLADADDFPILGNRRYFLKVRTDGKEFNASCRIPEKVPAIDESIEFREAEFGGQEAEINLSFQDFSGQRNYYILGGKVITTFQNGDEEPQTIVFRLFFDTDEFLSDNLEDGGTLNGTSETFIDRDTEVSITRLTLQVAHVEEVLFQNLRTASTNADAEDNPFVEYSIAPNNFEEEEAVGVFAGYQLTEKEVTVNPSENP